MATTKKTETQAQATTDNIATEAENAKLQHTEGGITTRDDRTDMGVPMLQGSGEERQGPEDALGPGPKRGDYTGRIGASSYQPHEIVPVKGAKAGEPQVEVQAQRPRTTEIGDAEGLKGGVDTV